jgi:benzoyl-CoA reductase subunit D
MFVAGIDVGSRYIKALIINDSKKIIAKKKLPSSFENRSLIKNLIKDLSGEVGIDFNQIKKIGITGSGRDTVDIEGIFSSEVMSAGKAVYYLYPEVRTIIEVGAEESRAIKVNSCGKVVDVVVNEKCAAGTGTFVELMARTLEISLEEFGKMALQSESRIPMNAQCIVFAESEVVSLIHSGVDRKDIARAIHDAIASRISAMARRVRVEPEVALIGGLANNPGFVFALKSNLEIDNLLIPEEPQYIGAYGASLIALDAVSIG